MKRNTRSNKGNGFPPEVKLKPKNSGGKKPDKVKKRNFKKKRSNYLEWDRYFMGVALLSAKRSKDPKTQVCSQLQHHTKLAAL